MSNRVKTFRKCGFSVSDLVPVKKKMYAANNEGINILGAVFARLSGNDENGNRLETAEMIYVSDTTDLFYLSRHAMEQLKIIGQNFPRVGAAASLSETINKPTSEDQKHSVSTTTPNNEQTAFSEVHTLAIVQNVNFHLLVQKSCHLSQPRKTIAK